MKGRGQAEAGRAFTLLEAVVALVVLGLLGAMVVTVLDVALARSGDPVVRLRKSADLQSTIERVIKDYESTYVSDLPGLKARIEAHPAEYGTYVLVPPSPNYIAFSVAGTETAGTPTDVLKVVVANSNGERLTHLFPHLLP